MQIQEENQYNPIKDSITWQIEKGLSKKPYNKFNEAKMLIEESLEVFNGSQQEDLNFYPYAWLRAFTDHLPDRSQVEDIPPEKLKDANELLRIFDNCTDKKIYIDGEFSKVFDKIGITDPDEITNHIINIHKIVMEANWRKAAGNTNKFNKLEKQEGFHNNDEKLKEYIEKEILKIK